MATAGYQQQNVLLAFTIGVERSENAAASF